MPLRLRYTSLTRALSGIARVAMYRTSIALPRRSSPTTGLHRYRHGRTPTVFDECSCKKDADFKCPAFVDLYKFGMRSQFVIGSPRADPFYVLSAIAEAFVFIMISSSLVAVVTFYLIPSKSSSTTRAARRR